MLKNPALFEKIPVGGGITWDDGFRSPANLSEQGGLAVVNHVSVARAHVKANWDHKYPEHLIHVKRMQADCRATSFTRLEHRWCNTRVYRLNSATNSKASLGEQNGKTCPTSHVLWLIYYECTLGL